MEKNSKYEGLNLIPKYVLVDLKEYLKDNEGYFKQQLNKTGIMIEKDDYQISLKSVDDFDNLINELNTDEYKQCSCA